MIDTKKLDWCIAVCESEVLKKGLITFKEKWSFYTNDEIKEELNDLLNSCEFVDRDIAFELESMIIDYD